MNITRRQVVVAMLVIQLIMIALIAIGQAVIDPDNMALPGAVIGTVATIAIFFAYLRGWESALIVDVVIVTVLLGVALPGNFVTNLSALIVLVPPALALILVRPVWIIASTVILLTILSIRAGMIRGEPNYWTAYTGDIRTLSTVFFVVGSMFLSRLVADTAARAVAAEAANTAAAQQRAELQAAALAGQAAALREQNAEQERLLELVATLETPAVELAAGVLLAPLMGRIDHRRMEVLTWRLLDEVREHHTRLVILDIAGVAEVDPETATALVRTAQALRLLGCDVAITGIAPGVAPTLSENGLLQAGIRTAHAPQDILAELF